MVNIRMLKFYSLLIKLLNIEHFKYRGLTQGEIEISQRVFGNLIDYQRVRIFNQPYLPWQPKGIAMAPNGCIHFKAADYCSDFIEQSHFYQAVFIHEMAHIYQYQRKENVLLKGAILQMGLYLTWGKYNPYRYKLIKNKCYFDYNLEQQGDIAKDIYMNRIPNIILYPELTATI